MVKDIYSGSSNSDPDRFAAMGNTLYFRSRRRNQRNELWKSDGTSSGTVMVKDIYSGGDSNPYLLTAVGNTLYFQARDGTNGYELWKSDGTASGTVMVKDINSGSSASSPGDLTAIGNTLYFSATRRNQRKGIVEERWNCLRHGDGQGYLQRKWQQFSLLPHSRWQHPLFPSQRRNQRKSNCGRAMELPQAR